MLNERNHKGENSALKILQYIIEKNKKSTIFETLNTI